MFFTLHNPSRDHAEAWGDKGRVAGYPPLLACRSMFYKNGRLPLPPGERKIMVVLLL